MYVDIMQNKHLSIYLFNSNRRQIYLKFYSPCWNKIIVGGGQGPAKGPPKNKVKVFIKNNMQYAATHIVFFNTSQKKRDYEYFYNSFILYFFYYFFHILFTERYIHAHTHIYFS